MKTWKAGIVIAALLLTCGASGATEDDAAKGCREVGSIAIAVAENKAKGIDEEGAKLIMDVVLQDDVPKEVRDLLVAVIETAYNPDTATLVADPPMFGMAVELACRKGLR